LLDESGPAALHECVALWNLPVADGIALAKTPAEARVLLSALEEYAPQAGKRG
jgi:hypothetical protein